MLAGRWKEKEAWGHGRAKHFIRERQARDRREFGGSSPRLRLRLRLGQSFLCLVRPSFPTTHKRPPTPPGLPSLAAVDTHILPALALAAYFLDSLLHRPA